MVYKKYIKKNGKLYGPYYYHSKRVDGKVVSEYHGVKKKEVAPKKSISDKLKKSIFFLLGAIFIIGGIYFFVSSNFGSFPLAGFATLNLNADYIPGENLKGSLSLMLNEGELLPASSQIIFESANDSYSYSLQDVVTDEKIIGSFYFAGGNIRGEGIGYGIEGRKLVYPELSFKLLISEKISSEESLEKEIEGVVSRENNFVYELKENESAQIKYLSVKNSLNEKLPDEIVNLEMTNKTAVVSTNYSASEFGFGEDYRGEGVKLISIDLSKFNLNLSDPNIKVKLVYSDSTLVDLSVQLKEEIMEEDLEKVDKKQDKVDEKQDDKKEEREKEEVEVINDSKIEIVDKYIVDTLREEIESVYTLNEEDRDILRKKFPNSSIQTTKSILKNSRIFIRYELEDYWFDATYDSNSPEEFLKQQMELDKTRWLRDIINKIIREDNPGAEISEFLTNYPI